MTIYQLKTAFQDLLRPVSRRMAGLGITANQVTLLALLLSLVIGILLALNPTSRWILMLIPVWLFFRMALNAIDGMLAREHGMQSTLGGLLNELSDVVSDAALYLPFALIPGIPPWPVVLIVVLAIISEMAGVVAVQVGASRRYDGPMGKSDRAFIFGLLATLLAFDLGPGWWSNSVLVIVMVLTALTVINRSYKALCELRNKSS